MVDALRERAEGATLRRVEHDRLVDIAVPGTVLVGVEPDAAVGHRARPVLALVVTEGEREVAHLRQLEAIGTRIEQRASGRATIGIRAELDTLVNLLDRRVGD